ncbi:MAG: beta-ketoacyl-ACP synthase III, partial [Candidatus Hydrogenedentes bacterium]|nr:beta-ketoacyl-ACP synthase III [Candidatus Hydrogenedentota bacterium]
MTRARITGTGNFLPEKILSNKDLESMADTTDEWIVKRTGIRERRVAEPGETTSDLAARALQVAIDNAGMNAKELDVVICCTITPDYLLPASACVVQAKLGAVNAAAFDIGAACSGFMYGLGAGTSFIESGLFKTVGIVCAELVSNRIIYENRDTGVLFGDGAGAVVLQADEGDSGVLSMRLGSDGSDQDVLIVPYGGAKWPSTKENIEEFPPFTVNMNGRELFKRAVTAFPEAAQQALDATGLSIDDIKLFVPHQANTRILESAAKRMGMPMERVYVNIDKVGNTIAASIPIALHEANAAGRIEEGDHVLFVSFGAGLTWG